MTRIPTRAHVTVPSRARRGSARRGGSIGGTGAGGDDPSGRRSRWYRPALSASTRGRSHSAVRGAPLRGRRSAATRGRRAARRRVGQQDLDFGARRPDPLVLRHDHGVRARDRDAELARARRSRRCVRFRAGRRPRREVGDGGTDEAVGRVGDEREVALRVRSTEPDLGAPGEQLARARWGSRRGRTGAGRTC